MFISISPSPRSGPHGVQHAEPSRISADIPMKSSVRPSPFFAPHPACNEHPDWGRSHGVGFSFHWLEILNPRGVVVVVVHGCFSHGFAAPLAISISCWYVGSVKNWKPTLHRNPTVGHVVSSHLTYPSHLRSWCSSTSMRPRTRPPRNHWYPKDWRVHLFVIILHMNMWQFGVISGQTHVGTGQDFKTPNMFLWHTNWRIVRVHWYPCPYNEVN